MTTHTKELLPKPSKIALISIRPCFVEKILRGEKRLEFRRSWAAEPVDVLVIYSTSPIQRIVATARVLGVTECSPHELWALSKQKKGGVSRKLIYDYFAGKQRGFAIEIGDVLEFEYPIEPKRVFKDFVAPQSFRYLDVKDYKKLLDKAKKS